MKGASVSLFNVTPIREVYKDLIDDEDLRSCDSITYGVVDIRIRCSSESVVVVVPNDLSNRLKCSSWLHRSGWR
jgi:hypothetical protein